MIPSSSCPPWPPDKPANLAGERDDVANPTPRHGARSKQSGDMTEACLPCAFRRAADSTSASTKNFRRAWTLCRARHKVHYPEPIFMRRRPVSANAGTVIWPTVDRHKTRRIRGSGGRRACQAWASKFPSPLVRGRHGPKRPPWPRASSGDLSRCIAQWWRHRHDQGSRV